MTRDPDRRVPRSHRPSPPIARAEEAVGSRRARQPTPDGEAVAFRWVGATGPRPSLLSLVSCLLVIAVFAHLVLPLPSWWPFGAGLFAICVNAALAWWQAGSYRVVLVTPSGVHVMRTDRWSSRSGELVTSMPRMPLGPLAGRWAQMSLADTALWVHHRHHDVVGAFDTDYRSRFATAHYKARGTAATAAPTSIAASG